MASVLEFFGSLSVVGWVLVVICILLLLNIRKIFRLRTPLDSQQHKSWRASAGSMHGGNTKADHLEKEDKEI